MFIAKGLLIKGLGGLGALAGSGALAFGIHKIFSNSDNTEINKKITALGLPEGCKFSGDESNNTKKCTLNKDQLKVVNFSNKENTDLTISDLDNSQTITLEIKKFNTPTEEDKKRYKTDLSSDDLWFTFKTESITADIKVKKESTEIASLIKGANPEFKINNNKLEKAWTVTTLGEKVGLTCPVNGNNEKKCNIEANKTVKFSEDGTEFKDFTSSSQETEKITYTEDQQDHNQGFKFNVSTAISGNNSISLAVGNYEIKYEEGKGWHLAKKTNVAA